MHLEIPNFPLQPKVISGSNFPDVALHARRGEFIQESSYSMPLFAGAMFAVALACCFIPWNEKGLIGIKVIYFIAAGIAWGGICTLGVYFVRNAVGQRIIVEPKPLRVIIMAPAIHRVIPGSDLIGIQLCEGADNSYQTNLVYRNAKGEIARHCLYCHYSKSPCAKLAAQYQRRCGFEVMDHIVDESPSTNLRQSALKKLERR
jgi:hypothetical protein